MARFRFNKGDKVVVAGRNTGVIVGVIRDADINLCTFKNEYCVDFEEDGRLKTAMCVPESAIMKCPADKVAAASMKANLARAYGKPYRHFIEECKEYGEFLESLGRGVAAAAR